MSKFLFCIASFIIILLCEAESLSSASSKASSSARNELVLNKIPERNGNHTDNYSGFSNNNETSLERINDATFTTASLMSQILRKNDNAEEDEHDTVQYLNRVKNPEEVANELEFAAKYLTQQAKFANKNRTDDPSKNEDRNSDLVRVFDGFVFLTNLYDSLVRPGQFSKNGRPTLITVSPKINPWFEVDEKKNELTVSLTLTQEWMDTRFAYQSRLRNPAAVPFVTVQSQLHFVEIWVPDTFIVNEKHSSYKPHVATHNDLIRITPQGKMSRELKLVATIHCPFFNNERFPFDTPTCSLNFSSFSWNRKNLQYRWDPSLLTAIYSSTFLEFKGFIISSIQLETKNFTTGDHGLKSGSVLGEPSGLSIKFQLERNISPYVTKLFLPLALFCLIAIAGLLPGIEPEIGCALSYFMFGLQSIFMAISFNGPDFNWGNTRTALDSYYVFCVFTILLTGIANLIKLRGSSANGKLSSGEESFEMRDSSPHPPAQRIASTSSNRSGKSSNNGKCSMREERLWKDSDTIINDNDNDLEENENNYDHHHHASSSESTQNQTQTSRHFTGISGFTLFGLKSVKIMWRKMRRGMSLFCYRLNDFSIWILLAFFVSWNILYWVTNLQ